MKALKTAGKVILWMMALLFLLTALLVVLLPVILPRLPAFDSEFDLGPQLSDEQRRRLGDTRVKLRWQFVPSEGHDLAVRGQGSIFGLPFSVCADVDYSVFTLSAEAFASCGFEATPWRINGHFSGSAFGGWCARAQLPNAAFTEQDPVLCRALSMVSMPKITDLHCSGQIGLDLSAFTTNGLPTPTWSASANLLDVSLQCLNDETPVAVEDLRLRLAANGIGSHRDVRPIFPRVKSVAYGDILLNDVYAELRVDDRSILVSEAGAQTFGGNLRLYALTINPRNLDARATIFLDNIDSSEILRSFGGFKSRASGRLHGRLPIRLRKGEKLALETSYLYSVPGEVGEIQIDDPAVAVDNLASVGVSVESCSNLSKVLQNLSYSALTMDLSRESAHAYVLSFKLQGSATRGRITVPVAFEIRLHGDLEHLINTGLRASRK